MRVVTYGAACSLDGFIAGPAGEVDWLHMSRDVRKVMAEYWAMIDAMIMGRKTWDVMVAHSAQGGANADAMGRVATYVCSRTLAEIAQPGVELVSSEPGAFVRDLKRRPGRGICMMGGGELAAALLDAGVIDEIRLNIHPIVLGAGIRLFGPTRHPIPLTLTEQRAIDGGCVLASYVVGAARGRA